MHWSDSCASNEALRMHARTPPSGMLTYAGRFRRSAFGRSYSLRAFLSHIERPDTTLVRTLQRPRRSRVFRRNPPTIPFEHGTPATRGETNKSVFKPRSCIDSRKRDFGRSVPKSARFLLSLPHTGTRDLTFVRPVAPATMSPRSPLTPMPRQTCGRQLNARYLTVP